MSSHITFIMPLSSKANQRGPEHSISSKNNVLLFTFRRDLNEAKVVYISEYYLLLNCNYDAPIMPKVLINVNY